MELEFDEEFLKIQQSDIEHDQELLQIQRRKSTPKVVVEEFVQVDSDEEPDEDPKQEEAKESDDIMCDSGDCKVSQRPHRLKTHIEIEDVSLRLFNKSLRKGTTAFLTYYIFYDL